MVIWSIAVCTFIFAWSSLTLKHVYSKYNSSDLRCSHVLTSFFFIMPPHTKYGDILFSGCPLFRFSFIPSSFPSRKNESIELNQILHI